jgi:DNA-binding PadR family transcriptional regulator
MKATAVTPVVLGLLAGKPRSGYDIKTVVDRSTRFFWAASYGQIYPELKRLEKAGLIAGVEDPAGGRQRRAYTITATGEEALHDWLASGSDLHFELRHEGVLRFFFADALEPDERLELLETIRAEHLQVRRELQQIQPAAEQLCAESGDRFPLLTLETGIAYQDFFLNLCDRLKQRLAEPQPVKGGP